MPDDELLGRRVGQTPRSPGAGASSQADDPRREVKGVRRRTSPTSGSRSDCSKRSTPTRTLPHFRRTPPRGDAERDGTLLRGRDAGRPRYQGFDLDADFTYVNERLAKHYGISGVTGEEFREVPLKGGRRGGVLTQASVLTVTSNPTRTSPVKRGKWILSKSSARRRRLRRATSPSSTRKIRS